MQLLRLWSCDSNLGQPHSNGPCDFSCSIFLKSTSHLVFSPNIYYFLTIFMKFYFAFFIIFHCLATLPTLKRGNVFFLSHKKNKDSLCLSSSWTLLHLLFLILTLHYTSYTSFWFCQTKTKVLVFSSIQC
jgi:hypothetical protein